MLQSGQLNQGKRVWVRLVQNYGKEWCDPKNLTYFDNQKCSGSLFAKNTDPIRFFIELNTITLSCLYLNKRVGIQTGSVLTIY